MKRTSALFAALLLASPLMASCYSGFGATTSYQAGMNSGNGTDARVGAIDVEDATVVMGPEGSTTATLMVRLVNSGLEDDTLVYVTINGEGAYITPDATAVPANSSIAFGIPEDATTPAQAWINSYSLEVPVSSYVPVEFGFENAGVVKMSVLTVPATGYYAGIAPEPAAAPAG